MKVEINTEELFCSEGQTANEYLRCLVVEEVARLHLDNLDPKIDKIIDERISYEVSKRVSEMMEGLAEKVLDHEFTETTSWGEKKDTYTVRNRILKHVQDACAYKKTNYSSDRGAFTAAIDKAVEKNLAEFQKEFYKEADGQLLLKAMEYAKNHLSNRLGLK